MVIALHCINSLIINDTTDSYITQYPFLPVGTGNTTGIGTFGSEFNGSNLDIKFFPDAGVSNVTVQTHSEIIQTTSDLVQYTRCTIIWNYKRRGNYCWLQRKKWK